MAEKAATNDAIESVLTEVAAHSEQVAAPMDDSSASMAVQEELVASASNNVAAFVGVVGNNATSNDNSASVGNVVNAQDDITDAVVAANLGFGSDMAALVGCVGNINAPTNDMEAIMRNIARYRESHPHQPFVEVEPKSPEHFSASRAPYSFVTDMAGYTPFTPSHKKNNNADGFTMVSSRKWRGRSASPPDNHV